MREIPNSLENDSVDVDLESRPIEQAKPSFARTRRAAAYAISTARRAFGLSRRGEIIEDIQQEKLANAVRLERRSRTLVNVLRETFGGDALNQGLIVRPRTPSPMPRDVTVQAVARDTATAHNTAAIVDIVSQDRVTRLAIDVTEPTMGAKHLQEPVEQSASVRVVDPLDMDRVWDPMQLGLMEQTMLVGEADHSLALAVAACDRGECEVYASMV